MSTIWDLLALFLTDLLKWIPWLAVLFPWLQTGF